MLTIPIINAIIYICIEHYSLHEYVQQNFREYIVCDFTVLETGEMDKIYCHL